jgi:hypothetical protein
MTSNTQKLIDIAFEIALTMKQNIEWVEKSSDEEIAQWVSKQLSQCGYQTIPLGASYGILKKSSK